MESAGPEPGRARGARLVQGLGRLPVRSGRDARERRLGGEPDRARLRPRGARPARCATTSSPTSPIRRTPRSRGPRACSASGSDQVRVLPVDDTLPAARRTCSPRRSRRTSPRAAGRCSPSANGGATNTGAVDPLPEVAAVCKERGVWFHVDAAYGGFAVLTEAGREHCAGIELADSITLDPHKWLYQPYECGCLLVRDGPRARSAPSTITPDYLDDAVARAGEINFSDLGMQLSRSSRALKIWLSIRYFGLDAFRARRSSARSTSPGSPATASSRASELELLAPPSLGVVCFRRPLRRPRRRGGLDTMNGRLVSALEASGLGLVSSTRLHGRYAIRLCVLSHTTGTEDVERVLDFLETAEVGDTETSPSPPTNGIPTSPRAGRSARGPLHPARRADAGACDAGSLRSARRARPRRVTTIIEQWASTRLLRHRRRNGRRARRRKADRPGSAPVSSSARSPRSTGEPGSGTRGSPTVVARDAAAGSSSTPTAP